MKAVSPNIRSAKKPAQIKYSSDEDDSNNEMPVIPTAKQKNKDGEFLSDYSYDGSYYYSSDNDPTPVHRHVPTNNQTPASNKAPATPSPKPPNRQFIRPKRPMPVSRPLPQKNKPQLSPKAQSDSYEEDSQSYSDEKEEIKPQPSQQEVNHKSKRISRPESNPHTNQQDIKPQQNQPQNEPQTPQPEIQPQKSHQEDQPQTNQSDIQTRSAQQKIEPIQNQAEPANQPQQPQPVSSPQQPQPVSSPQQPQQNPAEIQSQSDQPKQEDEEKTYQIVYEQKNKGNFWKRYVQMLQNDVLYYICKSVKISHLGKVHVICTKKPVDVSSPNFAGMVVRHQSGSRFTLYQKGGEIGPSNPQIAGIAFVDIKSDIKIRMFRVAIPTTDEPYIPRDKYGDLSRIAYNEENVPNVKVYSSCIPHRKPGGGLTLNFGHYQIVTSTKNFIVRDENDTPLFVHFKTFGGVCTLKLRKPFTELIGFAIAVAISTSTK